MTIEIITLYKHARTYRTHTFDPETYMFQQTYTITARGKRPPEMEDFVENVFCGYPVYSHDVFSKKVDSSPHFPPPLTKTHVA